MKRSGAWLLCLFILAACGGRTEKPNIPPGWSSAGDPRLFRGAELYGHINGGSEIFLELGFDRLEVAEFRKGDEELSVDHYSMTDASAALAIYLMKCGAETPSPEISARHTASPMQIHMVHGSSYVTVNNLSGTPETAAALVPFAHNLVEFLPAEQPLHVLDVLPSEEKVPGSERIIRGPFTLQALYTFGDGDILQLANNGATAVSADYGAGDPPTTLILVDYPTAGQAMAAFNHLNDNLDAYLEPVHQEATRLVFKDWNERFGVIALLDSRIELRIHLLEDPGAGA